MNTEALCLRKEGFGRTKWIHSWTLASPRDRLSTEPFAKRGYRQKLKEPLFFFWGGHSVRRGDLAGLPGGSRSGIAQAPPQL